MAIGSAWEQKAAAGTAGQADLANRRLSQILNAGLSSSAEPSEPVQHER